MKQFIIIALFILTPSIFESVDQWKVGYAQGYVDGKWNKAHDDFSVDEVNDICNHHTDNSGSSAD